VIISSENLRHKFLILKSKPSNHSDTINNNLKVAVVFTLKNHLCTILNGPGSWPWVGYDPNMQNVNRALRAWTQPCSQHLQFNPASLNHFGGHHKFVRHVAILVYLVRTTWPKGMVSRYNSGFLFGRHRIRIPAALWTILPDVFFVSRFIKRALRLATGVTFLLLILFVSLRYLRVSWRWFPP
jgi:hypothetical protein